MEDCEISTIFTIGDAFIWQRNTTRDPLARKRLDCAMVNGDWINAFPRGFVEILPRRSSDHNGLLFRCFKDEEVVEPRLFRWEFAWTSHPHYPRIVEVAWHGERSSLPDRIKQIQESSLHFNKVTFGNIIKRKKRLIWRLEGIH